MRYEFQAADFRVFEFRARARDAAEDLDSGTGGVAEEAEEGEADADGDADAEVPEEGGEEDEEHEEEFAVARDHVEEVDVVGGFFNERVGDDGDHCGEYAFLWRVLVGELRNEKRGENESLPECSRSRVGETECTGR